VPAAASRREPGPGLIPQYRWPHLPQAALRKRRWSRANAIAPSVPILASHMSLISIMEFTPGDCATTTM
jgi:hypothetical protein